jgi:hypothetical protein
MASVFLITTLVLTALDYDESRQRSAGRWRCLAEHLAPALDDALQTNFSLGWTSVNVEQLLANLSTCEAVILDDRILHEWIVPFSVGLTIYCESQQHPPLQELEMVHTGVFDEGLSVLAPALAQCTSMEALHMFGIGIGDTGVRTLVKVLHTHFSLHTLDLGQNAIRNIGAIQIASLLRPPPFPASPLPLADLRLHDNYIGESGLGRCLPTRRLEPCQPCVAFPL